MQIRSDLDVPGRRRGGNGGGWRGGGENLRVMRQSTFIIHRSLERARGNDRTKANVYGVFYKLHFQAHRRNEKTGSIPARLLFGRRFLRFRRWRGNNSPHRFNRISDFVLSRDFSAGRLNEKTIPKKRSEILCYRITVPRESGRGSLEFLREVHLNSSNSEILRSIIAFVSLSNGLTWAPIKFELCILIYMRKKLDRDVTKFYKVPEFSDLIKYVTSIREV